MDINKEEFDEQNKINYYYCICNGITDAKTLAAKRGLSRKHADCVISEMLFNKYIERVVNLTEEQFIEKFGKVEYAYTCDNQIADISWDSIGYKLGLYTLMKKGKVSIVPLLKEMGWGYVKCLNFIDRIVQEGYTEYKIAVTPQQFIQKNGDPKTYCDPSSEHQSDSYSFVLPDKPIKIFGFGGVGIAAANEISQRKGCKDICCVISNDAQQLRQSVCANKYEVKSPVPECGAVSDPDSEKFALDFLGDSKIVIILTCSCGCGIAAPVAAAALKAGKCCIAIVTKPNKPNADGQIKLIKNSGAAVTVLNKEDGESQEEAANKQFEIMRDILLPIILPSALSVNIQDFVRIFKDKTRFEHYSFTVYSADSALADDVRTAVNECGAIKNLSAADWCILQIRSNSGIPMDDMKEIVNAVSALNKNANVIFGANVYDNYKYDGITVSIIEVF